MADFTKDELTALRLAVYEAAHALCPKRPSWQVLCVLSNLGDDGALDPEQARALARKLGMPAFEIKKD